MLLQKIIGASLKEICLGITERYEVEFIEIGHEPNHVHFLLQSVPSYSMTEIVRMIKSITAKRLFQLHPEIKEILWGGNFWTSGYYANEEVIRKYVESQGMEKQYKKVHEAQIKLF